MADAAKTLASLRRILEHRKHWLDDDEAKAVQDAIAEIEGNEAKNDEIDQRYCDMLDQRDDARRENARLKAEVERLTSKPLNCFEVRDVFNAHGFKGRTDWQLFAEGDEPFHVGTESGRGGYFDADSATYIAEGLVRESPKARA